MRHELSVPLFPASPGCEGHRREVRNAPGPAALLQRRQGDEEPQTLPSPPSPTAFKLLFFPHFKII